MRIQSLKARPILDSRGQWTVEAAVILKNGARAAASVPQGKSTGSSEARSLPAATAVRRMESIIAPRITRREFRTQEAVDAFLNKLDGTSNKSRLGANAILATSIAFLRATAQANGIPLWKHVRKIYGLPAGGSREIARPRLFINVVNGGLHAGNNLDFQEYLIIPKCRTIKESVEIGAEAYHALGEALAAAKGKTAKNIGDEGGYAPEFRDNLEPFRIIEGVLKKLKLAKKIDFGMDAAATDIGKSKKGDLAQTYMRFVHRYTPIYLEDPFGEKEFEEFASLTALFGKKVWITGDDLTTTNVSLMERAHAERSVNAVIIKPNQIGSVTEALDAVRAARKYGWAVIVSHRSGETEDDFIADFAYGIGADGLKLGAPARGERIAKYNRLLAIETFEDK